MKAGVISSNAQGSMQKGTLLCFSCIVFPRIFCISHFIKKIRLLLSFIGFDICIIIEMFNGYKASNRLHTQFMWIRYCVHKTRVRPFYLTISPSCFQICFSSLQLTCDTWRKKQQQRSSNTNHKSGHKFVFKYPYHKIYEMTLNTCLH